MSVYIRQLSHIVKTEPRGYTTTVMATLAEYVRKKREEVGLSQYALAQKSGLSVRAVQLIEKGERKPKVETLEKLARGLGVPFEEVAEVAGIPVLKSRKVPIISWASAGDWEEAIEYPEDWVEVLSSSPQLFALRVHGDSMEPEFTEGDIIVIDPDRSAVSGSFVLVRNGEGNVIFEQLKVYGEKTILRPLNPRYPEIEMTEDQEIIGVVCQKIKRY